MVIERICRNVLKKILLKHPILLSQSTSAYGNDFFGDFPSWEEARKQSTSYDSDVIFERVRDAALKVKNGEAVYEGNSVLVFSSFGSYDRDSIRVPFCSLTI